MIEKKCSKCGITKPVTEFYKTVRYIGGYHVWCIKCSRAYAISDAMKLRQKEHRARKHKHSIKLIVETGGTTMGGYKFVVLDHKKITGGQIERFNNPEYIRKESEKLFDFLTDNVPSKVFKALTNLIIDYDARKEMLGMDMNKFNQINQDLIKLQKENK